MSYNTEIIKREAEEQCHAERSETIVSFSYEVDDLYDIISNQNKQMLKLKKQKEEAEARLI